jgi:hypothetical protein
MRKTSTIKASGKRNATNDLAARKTGGVKGGFVIDWAATKPSQPGEERGVIAIIKPVGGA